MNKSDALKQAIENRKVIADRDFTDKVESLVWSIERKSRELRDLKKELTELTYEEITIPDESEIKEAIIKHFTR